MSTPRKGTDTDAPWSGAAPVEDELIAAPLNDRTEIVDEKVRVTRSFSNIIAWITEEKIRIRDYCNRQEAELKSLGQWSELRPEIESMRRLMQRLDKEQENVNAELRGRLPSMRNAYRALDHIASLYREKGYEYRVAGLEQTIGIARLGESLKKIEVEIKKYSQELDHNWGLAKQDIGSLRQEISQLRRSQEQELESSDKKKLAQLELKLTKLSTEIAALERKSELQKLANSSSTPNRTASDEERLRGYLSTHAGELVHTLLKLRDAVVQGLADGHRNKTAEQALVNYFDPANIEKWQIALEKRTGEEMQRQSSGKPANVRLSGEITRLEGLLTKIAEVRDAVTNAGFTNASLGRKIELQELAVHSSMQPGGTKESKLQAYLSTHTGKLVHKLLQLRDAAMQGLTQGPRDTAAEKVLASYWNPENIKKWGAALKECQGKLDSPAFKSNPDSKQYKLLDGEAKRLEGLIDKVFKVKAVVEQAQAKAAPQSQVTPSPSRADEYRGSPPAVLRIRR